MLEQCSGLPRQQTQCHRKNYRQQSSCEEGKYPDSACLIQFQTPTKLVRHRCEHGRLRERLGVLCGSQNESRSQQHLQVSTNRTEHVYQDEWQGRRTLFPPTTFPVLTSRQIRSPAVMRPKCLPSGFIHCNKLATYFGARARAVGERGAEIQSWPGERRAQDRRQRDILLTI